MLVERNTNDAATGRHGIHQGGLAGLRIDELPAARTIHGQVEPQGSQDFADHDLVRRYVLARDDCLCQGVASVIGVAADLAQRFRIAASANGEGPKGFSLSDSRART